MIIGRALPSHRIDRPVIHLRHSEPLLTQEFDEAFLPGRCSAPTAMNTPPPFRRARRDCHDPVAIDDDALLEFGIAGVRR